MMCGSIDLSVQTPNSRAIVELLEGGANPSIANEKDAQTPLHALLYASQVSGGFNINAAWGLAPETGGRSARMRC